MLKTPHAETVEYPWRGDCPRPEDPHGGKDIPVAGASEEYGRRATLYWAQVELFTKTSRRHYMDVDVLCLLSFPRGRTAPQRLLASLSPIGTRARGSLKSFDIEKEAREDVE